ncbi:hypothetical protein AB0M91_09365 [Micromonospora rifamycinica]|uniref:hypothetical protein n=1 Tax=Micromonospora rifamycinica TaxID=291594 RepID=UPI003422AACC
MARNYTTAAARAAATGSPDPADPAGLLAWVGKDTTRARQALRDLESRPVDPRDTQAAADRQHLVDRLLSVFPSFTIDGVVFRVLGEMQLLDLCELMKLNRRGVKTVDPAAIASLAEFFQGCLGAQEYERFRVHCRENAVEPDLLNDIMEGVVEDLSEVPTSRPSHSVGGPSNPGPGSKVDLPWPPASMDQDAFQAYLASQQQPATGPLGTPTPPPAPTPPTPGFVYFG